MSRLIALTLIIAACCVACSGGSPVAPSSFTVSPAGLDRFVEGGGGGGFTCVPGPCPDHGDLRVDAGDADFWGTTTVSQSESDLFAFSATSDLFFIAGHVTGRQATIEVTKGSMSVTLSLIGPNDEPFEVSGEAEPVQTLQGNSNCASKQALTTKGTFIFQGIGKTVITETHCVTEP